MISAHYEQSIGCSPIRRWAEANDEDRWSSVSYRWRAWTYQGEDLVIEKGFMGQSQLFHIGIGTVIMGLALLTLSAGRPPDLK